MIRTALALCLALPLASALLAQSPADLQSAIDEGIRRDAYKVDLHKKLADAKAAEIRMQANTLAQNGKFLFEAGRLNEAETNLLRSVKLDPLNKAAFYSLDLIREQRHRAENLLREDKSKQWLLEVDRSWRGDASKRELLPQPNSYARTNLVHTSNARQALYAKLDRIHLDQFQADGLPLGEVIKSLNDEAKKRDPDKRGVNFLLGGSIDPVNVAPGIDPATGLPVAPGGEVADITTTTIKNKPALTDLSLRQALEAITKVADRPIKVSYEDTLIGRSATLVMASRAWRRERSV